MTGNSSFEALPETAIEAFDRREQEHKHAMEAARLHEIEETKRAKIRRSVDRQETYQMIGVGILIVTLILGIAYAIYRGSARDDGPDGITSEERREQACVAAGGGWVPEDLLAQGSHGICVFPGKSAEG